MRQHIDALEDHLVHRGITVVAALPEQRNRLGNHRQAVLGAQHFRFQAVGGQCGGVQQRLRQAIADRGVQALAFDFDRIKKPGVGEKRIRVAAFQQWLDVLLEKGHEIGAQEQGVAPAGTGILHRCAVAHRDAAVFELQQHRHALAGLAHRAKSRRERVADVDEAVLPGAFLDGLLIVEIE